MIVQLVQRCNLSPENLTPKHMLLPTTSRYHISSIVYYSAKVLAPILDQTIPVAMGKSFTLCRSQSYHLKTTDVALIPLQAVLSYACKSPVQFISDHQFSPSDLTKLTLDFSEPRQECVIEVVLVHLGCCNRYHRLGSL